MGMNKYKKKSEKSTLDYMDTVYDKDLKNAVDNKRSILFNASVTDNGVPADKVFKNLKEDLRGFHAEIEE